MRIHRYRHNPCNPRFGFKVTEPIGAVENRVAFWIFTVFSDFVIWL